MAQLHGDSRPDGLGPVEMQDPIRSSELLAFDGGEATPTKRARALLVDTEGYVEVVYNDGLETTDTLFVVAGVWHPMEFLRLNDAGTTAAGLHAGF